jgi:hypothetical protein
LELRRAMLILETGYLYKHFCLMLKTVEDKYSDLFETKETNTLERYKSSSNDAQNLVLRLLTRSATWYEVSKIEYAEIDNCAIAVTEALHKNLLETPKKLSFSDTFQLLSRSQCDEILLKHSINTKGSKSLKKGEYISYFSKIIPFEMQTLIATALSRTFVRPSVDMKNLFKLLQYLYFGNSKQTLTDFVLEELKVSKFESYTLHKKTRAFDNRNSLNLILNSNDFFNRCVEHLSDVKCTLGSKALFEIELQARELLLSAQTRSQSKIQKTLFEMGRTWERRGEFQNALRCYEGVSLASERLLRCLVKTGQKVLAIKWCQQLFLEFELFETKLHELREREPLLPHVHAPRHDALTYAAKLTGTTDLAAVTKPKHTIKLTVSKTLKAQNKGVESLALEHFSAEKWVGWHTENELWTSLFGLVFWEVIFQDVPGAFHHPFQAGPADGFSAKFYARRRDQADLALAKFENHTTTNEQLLDLWKCKAGIQNFWVHWREEGKLALEGLLTLASRRDLTLILKKMLLHPGHWDSGFPDLFLIKGNDFCLWEVKGPGDRLSPEQRSWISFFEALEWNAGVCYLEYT